MASYGRVVTLLTDFGSRMGYAGQMKGVIFTINPEARLVDLTHDVPPQSVAIGAMILEQSAPYFPTGTIHLAVVDPGVGTDRPAVIVETEKAIFVGPDNGLFGFLHKTGEVRSIWQIVNERYFLDRPSHTFHGRDVFAPVAAYLSLGYPADEFGPPLDALFVLPGDPVRRFDDQLIGEVMTADVFGNLITSISAEEAARYVKEHPEQEVYAWCAGQPIPIRRTFAEVQPGELLAYIGSGGRLEIAVNTGSALASLRAANGAEVKLLVL
ncbi:MAG: hypothetical protein C4523_06320 [Myxococcales bacterium]|nr:MAG: hypothetical protein C4523_06320 [Myxococcales bacterium]